MYISKFNYVSDQGKDHQRLLINFLTQSADIISSEMADFFLGDNEESILTKEEREYVLERGYAFDNKNQESLILEALYEFEKKNSAPIYLVYLGMFGKEKFLFDNISKKIDELIDKNDDNLKPELILYSDSALSKHLDINDLEKFLNSYHIYNLNKKIVTCPENISLFYPLLTKGLVTDITLICRLSESFVPPSFNRDTEEFLDRLIENKTNVILDLRLNQEDIEKLKPLVNYFIHKGWPFQDNFKCFISPLENEACILGYCYSTDIELTKKIFRVFKTFPQTELCSMEKWIGINIIHALIWRGKILNPSFHFCNASKGLRVITVDGDVFPCLKHAEKKHEIPKEIKIKLESFYQRKEITSTDCHECRYILSCGGGCGYKALINNSGRACCPPIKDLMEISSGMYFDEFLEKLEFLKQ
ncbi:MAG: SPASM domain-containing protein [Methanosarcina sp.]